MNIFNFSFFLFFYFTFSSLFLDSFVNPLHPFIILIRSEGQLLFKIIGKTYFEVPVLLLFSTFRPYTFILRYCILILYFHIDFVPHNPKIADQGFF